MDCKALEWFALYLADRTQRVTVNDGYHLLFHLDKEFLKGVVSGLFCLRSTSVSCLTLSASTSQVYTATQMTQLYLAFSPDVQGEDEAALNAMHDYIHDLRNWMIEDRLMLNDD